MINFEYIEIQFFGSIKRLRYHFNNSGINIIRGDNGVGKTTIFNALYWCLYGKVIKKNCTVEPWPIIIDDDYQGTMVKVVYNKDGVRRRITHCASYKGEIQGGKGKNRLMIKLGETYLDKLRDKSDGWKWIINDLGYSPELFKSSILFGQKVKRIMEEDGPSRNKILEEAYEATFISHAKLKVTERLALIKPEYDNYSLQIKSTYERITDAKTNLKNFEEQKVEFEKEKELAILNLKRKIDDLISARKEFREKLNKKINFNQKIDKLNKKLLFLRHVGKPELENEEFKLNLDINSLGDRIDTKMRKHKGAQKAFMNTTKNCNACGQPIPKETILEQKKAFKKLIQDLAKEIQFDREALEQMNIRYKEVTLELASFDKTINKINNIQTKIKGLESKRDYQRGVLEKITISTTQIESYLSQLEQEKIRELKDVTSKGIRLHLKRLRKDKKRLLPLYHDLRKKIEMDEWLIKDPLSNSGLKVFVLNALLQKTNVELRKYEKVNGFKISMGFNADNKRKDFYIKVFKGDLEIPHADLSGGQMQLCDVSIALAIHDTIADDKGCNIMLFDEVFESLSRNNIDLIGELLSVKSKGKSTHVITHTGFNPSNAHEITLKLNEKFQTIEA